MNEIKAKKVGAIVGLTRDNYIGYENDLMIVAMLRRMLDPEKIMAKAAKSQDMLHFRQTTEGNESTTKAVIMGRRTWESLNYVLPGRINVVITSKEDYKVPEGVLVFPSVGEALETISVDEAWLIGGAGIYDEALYYATVLHVCHLDFDASSVFDPSELKHNGVSAPDWMKSPEDHEYRHHETLGGQPQRYSVDIYHYQQPA